jgi:hypothetical protein
MRNIINKFLIFIVLITTSTNFSVAQTQNFPLTTVEGIVVDSIAGDTIPFASISLLGATQGVTTDENGHFQFSYRSNISKLQITNVGYRTKVIDVKLGKSQTILIKIATSNLQLNEVVVRKAKYRNKNNLAVDLVRKVIDKKDQNQLAKYDYYQYDKYERLELDLANVTAQLKDKKLTKNVNFFFADIDTSTIKGKSLLPVYIAENAFQVNYQKSNKSLNEVLLANKHSDLGTLFDDKGMNQYLNHLYVEANVYDNEILMFKKPFLGPLSPIAPTFYRYYIMDTVVVDGKRCVNLAFFPRSKTDLTFQGNLYITDDSLYALRKVVLSVPKNINVNYINDLKITQNFAPMTDGTWIKIHDEIELDLGIGDNKNGQGIYGKRNITYSHFDFNKPENKLHTFRNSSDLTIKENTEKPESYWQNVRAEKLTSTQQNIYNKTDSLMKVPDFKLFMASKYFMVTGYWQTKFVEFGPVATAYSYNDVEGGRIRLSGRTLQSLNKHVRLEGYGAYGIKDKQFKYNATVTYQLNDEPFGNRPQSAFKAWKYYDTEVPGRNIETTSADNWLLSFNRGKSDKMYYKQSYGLSYINEQLNGFSYTLAAQHRTLTPIGSLAFKTLALDSNTAQNITKIATNEVFLNVRYAPHEEYFQGPTFRKRIINKFPVFQAKFNVGQSKDAAGTVVNYQEVNVSAFKRFFLAPIGHTDILLEAGRVFGKGVPYPMLHNFSANQSLYYEQFSFNQMNYLEFISDKYASVNIEHAFEGFFLNKIPLIKKLKFREFVTFKAVYGGLDAANDPAKNTGLYAFPIDATTGKSLTYNFGKAPYMEASFGIGNIFKVGRIDVVRRINYLENPNVAPWRIALDINFGL